MLRLLKLNQYKLIKGKGNFVVNMPHKYYNKIDSSDVAFGLTFMAARMVMTVGMVMAARMVMTAGMVMAARMAMTVGVVMVCCGR